MHPEIIKEKAPRCYQYYEAILQCKKDKAYQQFFGACTETYYDLTNCLKEEKLKVRGPRQARYHERWAQKRQEDMERLEQLKQQKQASTGEAAAAATPSE